MVICSRFFFIFLQKTIIYGKYPTHYLLLEQQLISSHWFHIVPFLQKGKSLFSDDLFMLFIHLSNTWFLQATLI